MQVPDDLVEVGHVSGAYGIRGWIRIRPYSAEAQALLAVRQWWLDLPEWHEVEVMQARWHGDEIVARLANMTDRNAAEALRGRRFVFQGVVSLYWMKTSITGSI